MTLRTENKTRPAGLAQKAAIGLAIGLAGGLAEVLVVTAYATFARVDAAAVARGIAAAVRIEPASVGAGIALHMALSALVGIALLAVVGGRRGERSALPGYAIGLLALASVWLLNFFVVLPLVAPAFVHLLPYPVSLASKLMFGIVAVATLRTMTAARSTRAAPAVAASRRRSRPAV